MGSRRNAVGMMAAGLVVASLVLGEGLAAQVATGATGATGQAAPAAPESLERSFPFVGNELRVTIGGPGAGSLRVARGEVGQVGLVARSLAGVPATALADGAGLSELTLDSGPSVRVDYVLTIPAGTRLTVRLAGHPAASLSPVEASGGWTWPVHAAEALEALPQ